MRNHIFRLAIVLTGLTVITLASSAAAAAGQDAATASGVRLVAPETVDLGDFPYGPKQVKGSLVLRNAGTTPLELRRIRSGCLCMVLDPLEAKLAPGASLTVTLDLDLGYRQGPYTHPLMIYTDDPARPVTRIDVKVSVPMAVRFLPVANLIGIVGKGPELASKRFDLVVLALDGRPLAPPRITSTSPYLRSAEVSAEKLSDGTPYHRVKMALDPAIPYGDYDESLTIETMHPDQPTLTVPARWRVTRDLVAPDPLEPGLMEEGRPTTGSFLVRNLGSRQVNVVRTATNLGVPAEVAVVPKDKDLEVTLSIPDGPKAWALRGTVDLHTDHPDQPVVTIRVEGKVYARDPFARIAADGGRDAEFLEILKEALFNEEGIPMARILKGVLGGMNDDRVADLLLRALAESEYFPVRARAAEALGLLQSRRALDALTRAATYDLDNDVRNQAATAVYRIIGKDAFPLLELVVLDEEEFTREHIALLLGEIDDPRSVRLLRDLLNDPDGIVVSAAKESLKQLGADEVTRP